MTKLIQVKKASNSMPISKAVAAAVAPTTKGLPLGTFNRELFLAVQELAERNRLSAPEVMGLYQSTFSRNAIKAESGINSTEDGILYSAANMTILTNTRLRAYEDLASINYAKNAFPVNVITNVEPAINQFNAGDPAVTITVDGPILGVLAVCKPIKTLEGFFTAKIGFTAATAVRANSLFQPTHVPYSLEAQGSAFSDANNTGAIFMPAVFATPTLDYSPAGGYVQGAEVGTVQNVGLTSANEIEVSGANVSIQLFPLLATDAVQKAVMLASFAHEQLNKSFTKTFADVLYAQFSDNGQITA